MRNPSLKTSVMRPSEVRPGSVFRAAAPPISGRALAALTALILGATLVAYLPALRAGFIWDDDAYVTRNQTLRDLEGLRQIWFQVGAVPQYYPLVHTTFWLEYHLWGLHPLGYHLVNVLLHGLAAVMLGRVLMRLQVPGAWLAAALFALHPVQVESAAWITERKNVLSAVFYFAAALAYLRYAEGRNPKPEIRSPTRCDGATARREEGRSPKSDDPSSKFKGHGSRLGPGGSVFRFPLFRFSLFGWPASILHPPSSFFYCLALLLFLAALLSKTVTCSLPAALLLVCWWKQGRLRGADFRPLAPFFALGAGLGFLTTWMEKHMVGAQGADWSLTFVERCLVAARALWFYTAKLAWPANLTFIYPRWEINAAVWWQWLFPLGTLAVVAFLWLARRRLGRGPLTAVLFFGGTLFPALGFINTYPMRYSFVADHFQYLASAGWMVLAGAGLSRLADRAAAAGAPRVALRLGAVVWLLALGCLTWQQTGIYYDRQTLWRDTLAKNPACAMAHNNLGLELAAQGKSSEAETHYREAIRIKPSDLESLNNLGVALAERGQFDQAADLLRQALQLGPNNAKLLSDLAKALAGRGDHAQAMACFEKALRLEPQEAEHYYNLGTELAGLGRADEAIACYRQALQHNPKHVNAHSNLGLALAGQGRNTEAIEQYNEALRLAPNHALAHNNLGALLLAQGQLEPAASHFRRALQTDPDYANAHFNLARALSAQRKYDEAIAQYTETLRLTPGHLEARNNLALLLLAGGRTEEAVRHCEESLRLDPEQPTAHLNLGNALALQKKYEEAAGQFAEAVQLAPDNAQAHKNLGLALLRLGRREEAVAQFQEALRLKPDYEEAKQQLRALEPAR